MKKYVNKPISNTSKNADLKKIKLHFNQLHKEPNAQPNPSRCHVFRNLFEKDRQKCRKKEIPGGLRWWWTGGGDNREKKKVLVLRGNSIKCHPLTHVLSSSFEEGLAKFPHSHLHKHLLFPGAEPLNLLDSH